MAISKKYCPDNDMLNLPNYHVKGSEFRLCNGLYTFINPYSYLLARKNLKIFACFDRIFFDGIAILNLFYWFGIVRSERISFDMTSLAPRVLSFCADEVKSVYFIGSTSDEIRCAIGIFIEKYPQLIVAGYRHGYFENAAEITRTQLEILDLNPDVVIAGLGTPLQEKFLINLRSIGWEGAGFTCGGFFHQTAKQGIQYYPNWINSLNLRWAYRMYDEPKLIKRYLFQYPLFVIVFAFDVIEYYCLRTRNN